MANKGAAFQPILVADNDALNELAIKAGQFIIVESNGAQYIDTDKRIAVGGSGGGTANDVVINKATHFEFPSVGAINCIYIATEENKVYRYNPDTLQYVVVGSDYNDIKVIDGNSQI